jgi:N-methylhydantoinase A
VGRVPRRERPPETPCGPDPGPARAGERDVYLTEVGGFTRTPVYDRPRLRPGNRLEGPAVIEQMDSTTLVLPGQAAHVDGHRNLLLAGGSGGSPPKGPSWW